MTSQNNVAAKIASTSLLEFRRIGGVQQRSSKGMRAPMSVKSRTSIFITFDIARSKTESGGMPKAFPVPVAKSHLSRPHPYSRDCDAGLTRRVDEKFQWSECEIDSFPG